MKYILSISEINKYIKDVISRDIILSNLWVRGEISNCKPHYSGHIYLTLKDENSVLRCVMFKGNASGLKFVPENGMRVIVKGYVSVFERDGQYQLYAEEMQPDGVGSLHIAFEQLKKKLAAQGLFDESNKKKLPMLPRTIGVVTSSTGAVIKDIVNVLTRRYYNVELKLIPVAVQGEAAAGQIARAVRKFNQLGSVDVIIVARGGGSLEELWAFNEEAVAYSIFESEIPVISAVGHETDFTICDFVADMRAPTPSAAAELVIPEKTGLDGRITGLTVRLKNSLKSRLNQSRSQLERYMRSTSFTQPYNRVYQERIRLDLQMKYLQRGLSSCIDTTKSKYGILTARLNALSPLAILSHGYSVAKNENGQVIRSIGQVKQSDSLEVILSDGSLGCVVEKIENNKVPSDKRGSI